MFMNQITPIQTLSHVASFPPEDRARDIATLGELVELTMDLARKAHARACLVPIEPPPGGPGAPPGPDPALAFNRLASQVARLIALKRRLQQPARPSATQALAQEKRRAALHIRHRSTAIRRLLENSMREAANSGGAPFDPVDLERRLTISTYPDNAEHSVTETVAKNCRDLGIPIICNGWTEPDLQIAIEAELHATPNP